MITAVGQQLHGGPLAIGVGEDSQFGFMQSCGFIGCWRSGGMQVLSGGFRYALLKEQGSGLELWIGLEAALHGAIQ